jgi:hypothetical protein
MIMKVHKQISLFLFFLTICTNSCSVSKDVARESVISLPRRPTGALNGYDFFKKIRGLDNEERENSIEKEIKSGNFPNFMRKLVRINTSIITPDGKIISAHYYVMPDYLMIGSDEDFFRIPMQPKTAQKIADTFGCFLSTNKICDDIYKSARVKLDPYPLTRDRDSVRTFYLHNRIIENQRNGRKGLIAGIKKDVIISSAITKHNRTNRVAIYGWHTLDGNPIQPVYTGHVDWYVDYSHGIRLVHRTIYVDGEPMDYIDVLKDPELKLILCDETDHFDFFSYPYETGKLKK